jgi:hypothetical protein
LNVERQPIYLLKPDFPNAVKIALVEAIVNPNVVAKTDLSQTVTLTAGH